MKRNAGQMAVKRRKRIRAIIALGIHRDICSDNGDTYCVSDVRVYLAYFSLYHDTILWLENVKKWSPFINNYCLSQSKSNSKAACILTLFCFRIRQIVFVFVNINPMCGCCFPKLFAICQVAENCQNKSNSRREKNPRE